ncbi:MAG: hypothetical protein ACE5HZ_07195 [Fidelibacterota bacterium]
MVKRFEPEDPLELRGIEVPSGDLENQARVIMEEFFMMGMPRDEVLHLFENPFFSGTHNLFQRLGRERTVRLLDETWKPHGS